MKPAPAELQEPRVEPATRRARAANAIKVGLALCVVCAMAAFLPALLGRSSLNKFIVTFALLGTFIGLGCVVNGTIDRFRGRGR